MRILRRSLVLLLPIMVAVDARPVSAQYEICWMCESCFGGQYTCCRGDAIFGMSNCAQQPDFCMTYGEICVVWEEQDAFLPDGSLNLLRDRDQQGPTSEWAELDGTQAARYQTVALEGGRVVVRGSCNGMIARRLYAEEVQRSKRAASSHITI